MFILSILRLLLAIFPPWCVAVILGFISIIVILIVVKLVALVLDALPFL